MIQPKYQNYLVVSLSVLAVGVTMAMVQYKVPTIMIAIMEPVCHVGKWRFVAHVHLHAHDGRDGISHRLSCRSA